MSALPLTSSCASTGSPAVNGFRIVEDAAARRPVADAEDVPDQIVVVAEVLQGLAARAVGEIVRFGVALAAQALQAERVRIVGVAGHHAVAVGDERALALGVVGDALDIERVVQPTPVPARRRGCIPAAARGAGLPRPAGAACA